MQLTLGQTDKGKAFKLPLDLTTQTLAVLAKRGVGKTYTASVIAEELLAAKQQVVVLDPTGAWWGLRSSADGRGEGFPVVVIGGEHADVPLEEHAGEIIARAIVDRRFSAIIDLSLFRKGQMRRFVTSFLENLYRLNREPLHLIVDEADDIAPQKPFGDEAAMVGAMEDVVKRGRKKGIGCTLITQRPADLAKQVLTQCEMLVSMRIVHPRDIAAIREWINVHADPQQSADMMTALPSLPIGTAYFWSPGWGDIFDRVTVRRRTTFDSSATPKPGEKAVVPRVLAPVDKEKLGAEIAATMERAKADDPKELRRRIAELEKAKPTKTTEPDPAATRRMLEAAVAEAIANRDARWIGKLEGMREGVVKAVVATFSASMTDKRLPAPPRIPVVAPVAARPVAIPRPAVSREPASKLPKAEGRILTCLAQYGACSKNKIARIAGYAVTGGGFNNALGKCRSSGWVTDEGDNIAITEAGMAALGAWEPLPTGPALVDYWLGELPKAEKAILGVLRENPGGLTKADLAGGAGYEPAGGGFNNALGHLRTIELIEGPKRGDELIRLVPELIG